MTSRSNDKKVFVHVQLNNKPRYQKGDGPPLLPVMLTLPDKPTEWEVKTKKLENGIPIYGVVRTDGSGQALKVKLGSILDFISQKQFEDFEFKMKQAKNREKWERQENLLHLAEKIYRKRWLTATAAMRQRGEPVDEDMARLASGARPTRTIASGSSSFAKMLADSISSKGAETFNASAPTNRRKRKRKHTPDLNYDEKLKRQTLITTPKSAKSPYIVGSAHEMQTEHSLSQPSLSQPIRRLSSTRDTVSNDEISEDELSRSNIIAPLRLPVSSSHTPRTESLVDRDSRGSETSSSRHSTTSAVGLISSTPRKSNPLVQDSESEAELSRRSRSRTTSLATVSKVPSILPKTSAPMSSRKAATSTKSTLVPRPHPKVLTFDDTDYGVVGILNHREKKLRGKRRGKTQLEYLIDWECDFPGQWDPTWVKDIDVSAEAKTIYWSKFSVAPDESLFPGTSDDEKAARSAPTAGSNGTRPRPRKPAMLAAQHEDNERGFFSPSTLLRMEEREASTEKLDVVTPGGSHHEDDWEGFGDTAGYSIDSATPFAR